MYKLINSNNLPLPKSIKLNRFSSTDLALDALFGACKTLGDIVITEKNGWYCVPISNECITSVKEDDVDGIRFGVAGVTCSVTYNDDKEPVLIKYSSGITEYRTYVKNDIFCTLFDADNNFLETRIAGN